MNNNASEQFENLVLKVSELLKKEGVEKNALSEKAPFKLLKTEEQQGVIHRLQDTIRQIEIITPDKNAPDKLKEFCLHNNMLPIDQSVYTRLTNHHYWEVIDFKLNQIYRNNLIYRMVSYSYEELESYSPWQLFIRPASVLNSLIEVTENLKTTSQLINLESMPSYIIEEALSDAKLKFEIFHQFACPLISLETNKPVAFISTFFAKKLDDELKSKISFI